MLVYLAAAVVVPQRTCNASLRKGKHPDKVHQPCHRPPHCFLESSSAPTTMLRPLLRAVALTTMRKEAHVGAPAPDDDGRRTCRLYTRTFKVLTVVFEASGTVRGGNVFRCDQRLSRVCPVVLFDGLLVSFACQYGCACVLVGVDVCSATTTCDLLVVIRCLLEDQRSLDTKHTVSAPSNRQGCSTRIWAADGCLTRRVCFHSPRRQALRSLATHWPILVKQARMRCAGIGGWHTFVCT